MQVKYHLSIEALKKRDRSEKDVGRSKRVRIVILVIEGWTAAAVAASVRLL